MNLANISYIVADFSKMLDRLIGEDIVLSIDASSPTRNVMADTSQIEQVLMNLAINARDAMPKGGSFNIKISEVELGNTIENEFVNIIPGSYVHICVSDTGTGISLEEQEKIFEPFYTTKETGKGTGLGLATVYGIIKQHKGYIFTKSVLRKGTTFNIYLPVATRHEKDKEIKEKHHNRRGSETIMVVEDEPAIRKLIYSILKPLGYNVLQAGNGMEALEQTLEYTGKIDILLTDVIMPKMSGRELAESFMVIKPDTKIIYMSGYTDNEIARHGVLEDGVILIQKPITAGKLMSKISECIDAAA
jgi:CheY-like chemotaxis protein